MIDVLLMMLTNDDDDDNVLLQWGPYSEALQTLTSAGIPDAPAAPDIYFKSPTVAVISWQEPASNGAPVTEYHLEWTFRDDQDFMPVYCLCYVIFCITFILRLSHSCFHIGLYIKSEH